MMPRPGFTFLLAVGLYPCWLNLMFPEVEIKGIIRDTLQSCAPSTSPHILHPLIPKRIVAEI